MLLLLDIGNTHTHFAVWDGRTFRHPGEVPTASWKEDKIPAPIIRSIKAAGARNRINCALCSVVPSSTRLARAALQAQFAAAPFELTHRTVRHIGIRYPKPETIGPDRLANAVAARQIYGAPSVVVDFGTAVTFDVLDPAGYYVGGIIAPGLAAMTTYLHDKTALLPRIEIRDTRAIIGKSTAEAMLIGAVHGYRGLVRELIAELKRELGAKRLPVVATGGYAALIARRIPEIIAVDSLLTLKGLLSAVDDSVKLK